MSEIKAGILALIINSPFNENLGRVVTVEHFVGEHTSVTGTTKQNCWSVSVDSMPLSGTDHESYEVKLYKRGIIPGEWLMPITDLEENTTAQSERKGQGIV